MVLVRFFRDPSYSEGPGTKKADMRFISAFVSVDNYSMISVTFPAPTVRTTFTDGELRTVSR